MSQKQSLIFSIILIGLSLTLSLQSQTAEDFIDLCHACRLGDKEKVDDLLAKGVPINTVTQESYTPLSHALDTGHEELAIHLLSKGADPTIAYNIPLQIALRSSKPETIRHLLDEGAGLQKNKYTHKDAVWWAINWGNLGGLKELEHQGINLKTWEGPFNYNALTLAVRQSNLDLITYLIQRGLNVNEPDGAGKYPLAEATFSENKEVIELLLNLGANVNQVNQAPGLSRTFKKHPHTALYAAIRENRSDLVKLLLDRGADASALDNQALKIADLIGNQEIYSMLVKAGAGESPPFGFTNLDTLQLPGWVENPERYTTDPTLDWDLTSLLNEKQSPPEEKAGETLKPHTYAILPLGEKLENLSALLTAQLSSHESVTLVEREQLERVRAEHDLQYFRLTDSSVVLKVGQLLGADFLVLLSQANDVPVCRLVSTQTSLTLASDIRNKKEDLEGWCRKIANKYPQLANRLAGNLSEVTLVSIPRISASKIDPATRSLEKKLSMALSLQLGNQDDIYLLERKIMDKLAVESSLSNETQELYQSGFLIDGTFEQVPETAEGNFSLTLRLRQVANQEEIIVTQTGFAGKLPDLVDQAVKGLLAHIDSTETVISDTINEAETYLREAKIAYAANLWRQAESLSTAAWALGAEGNEVIQLRMTSMIHCIRISRELEKQQTENFYGDFQFLAFRAPLLIPPGDHRQMNAQQYLETSQTLLSLAESIVYSADPDNPSTFELDFLAFLPQVVKAANAPLEVMHALSYERVNGSTLADLRSRLLALADHVLAAFPASKHPVIYESNYICRLIHLPFWETDETKAKALIVESMKEAIGLEPPLSKHAVFKALDNRMRGLTQKAGGRANSLWMRILPELCQQENDDLRLLGLLYSRKEGWDAYKKLQLTEEIIPLAEKCIIQDTSISAGICAAEYKLNLPEKLRLNGSHKRARLGTIMWYPSPYQKIYDPDAELGGITNRYFDYPKFLNLDTDLSDAFKQRTNIQQTRAWERVGRARLKTMAQAGSPVTHHDIPHPIWETGQPEEEFQKLFKLVTETHEKILQHSEQHPYLADTAERFERKYIKPLKKQMQAPSASVAGNDSPGIEQQTGQKADEVPFLDTSLFLSPLLDTNIKKKKLIRRHEVKLKHDITCLRPAKNGYWIGVRNIGFINYSEDGKLIKTVYDPEDASHNTGLNYKTLYLDDRSIAVPFHNSKQHRSNDRIFATIGVYFFETGKWQFHQAPDVLVGGDSIESLAVLGDHLIYSFMANPNKQIDSGKISGDSETTKGIMQVDLKSGEERLLASHRRNPKMSPLDGKHMKSTYDLQQIDATRFFSHGHVFDVDTQEWTTASPADKEKAEAVEHGNNYYSQDGRFRVQYFRDTQVKGLIACAFTSSSKESNKIKESGKERIDTLYFKTDLSHLANIRIPSKYELMNLIQKTSAHEIPDLSDICHSQVGVVLYNELGFCLIPQKRLEELLPQAERASYKLGRDYEPVPAQN